jgi:hypothetical protein
MDSKPKQAGAMTTVAVAVVTLVIGGLIGFGITKAADHNKDKMTAMVPSTSTAAATLRANLVTLGVEHMTYTDQAVDAALDGNADASALGTILYANGNDIGAALGGVYGQSAATTFDSVWKLHLDDFVKYAVADKEGNQTAATAALTDINTNYTKPLAAFIAKANPYLPEATLESALNEHVQMTAQMINDHVQGNYTAEANELDMANTSISSLFSTLAQGIVKQYPTKF